MKTVKLIGKTRHGKNRIAQHGEIWEVESEHGNIMLLKSLEETFVITGSTTCFDKRWVSVENDRDFEVVIDQGESYVKQKERSLY